MPILNLMNAISIRILPRFQTPIAVVVYAGYKKKERVIKGRLNTILKLVGDEKFPFEHLVYVGDFLDQKRKKER